MTRRILLRGGLVADGIGSTTRRADVLIDDEAIAAVDARGTGRPMPAERDRTVPAERGRTVRSKQHRRVPVMPPRTAAK